MNYPLLLAAVFSLFAIAGHFTMGSKMYLKPVMGSKTAEVPKHVMRSLFHYMSVFLIFSCFVLFEGAFRLNILFKGNEVIVFTGLVYGGFALAQLLVAAVSGVRQGVVKMFQWIFWLLIATTALLGTM